MRNQFQLNVLFIQIRRSLIYSSILIVFIADNENDMNYYEIPNDVNSENHLNRIEGRHSTDDSVTILVQQTKNEKKKKLYIYLLILES